MVQRPSIYQVCRYIGGGTGQKVPLADHRNSIVATFSRATQNIENIVDYDPHGRVTKRATDESVTCQEEGNATTVCMR